MAHDEVSIYVTGYFPEYSWEDGPQRWQEDVQLEIDVKLAPLVEICWKAGIRTSGSCQGGPGSVYGDDFPTMIGFGRRGDMLRFRRLVGDHPGWEWQSGYQKWAVFFPYQQLPAVTKAARAFAPFYGEPPIPPKTAEEEREEPLRLPQITPSLVPHPWDEWATSRGRS